LRENDLAAADRIMRIAFGTFLGLPDPMAFMGDADYVRSRYTADPSASLAAEVDGRLVATNFATRWGSVAFFGPLTVLPEFWDRGVARALLGPTMELFRDWGVTHSGLFTFGHSPKHMALYQSFGFMPRFLTPVLARSVGPGEGGSEGWTIFSESDDQDGCIAAASAITNAIYPGLDVEREITCVDRQKLGDTVLVEDGPDLAAFATCHVGPGSEAGTGTCYVKFAAARPPAAHAAERFGRLLEACEAFAAKEGASVVVAGVNSARRGAYRMLLDRGYRVQHIGVAMHRPDEPGYSYPEAYVIDDWR
jgi:GNAT superfamily N-acetyltransferase